MSVCNNHREPYYESSDANSIDEMRSFHQRACDDHRKIAKRHEKSARQLKRGPKYAEHKLAAKMHERAARQHDRVDDMAIELTSADEDGPHNVL